MLRRGESERIPSLVSVSLCEDINLLVCLHLPQLNTFTIIIHIFPVISPIEIHQILPCRLFLLSFNQDKTVFLLSYTNMMYFRLIMTLLKKQ